VYGLCRSVSGDSIHTPHQTRQNSPVCDVYWRGGVNWTTAINVFTLQNNFLSATVLSCRESNSHCRSGRDTDKTVLSCLAWRCELALTHTPEVAETGEEYSPPSGRCFVTIIGPISLISRAGVDYVE